jgi:two-component system chemotaxis response regulator CheV
MRNTLASVDQRTRLAGQNRLELLLFRLDQRHVFGINVFKIREVINEPALKSVPQAHPYILGIANIRGQATPTIDLAQPLKIRSSAEPGKGFLLVTEFNRSVQAFRVASVDRIINISWESVMPPPKTSSISNYMTAVTDHEDQLVQLLDLERILADIRNQDTSVSESMISRCTGLDGQPRRLLVVDDSAVARHQMLKTLEQIGMEVELAKDGQEALELLQGIAEADDDSRMIDAVISDIEMPRMDGYTLCSRIRHDTRLSGLPVMLHTSLSGSFNEELVRQVGANAFLPKYHPDELVDAVWKIFQ